MPDYVIDPPEVYIIPVTKDCGVTFVLRREDAEGNPKNFDGAVRIEIDFTPTVVVDADVVDDSATFVIPVVHCNAAKNKMKWRIIHETDTVPEPLLVGVFERDDG